ncbi:MAG TPA: TOMM precursor leader peptide-binding protein [Capillimicrobium sp.]|jgi:bacteriocin biosynthesis cyclodehydratase domain-containing protein
MRRPRLKRSVDARLTADGTLYLLRGDGQDDLAIRGDGDRAAALVRLCDGSRSLDDVLAELAIADPAEEASVVTALDALAAAGALDDAADDLEHLSAADAERFERQLAFYGDVLPPGVSAAEAQARLRASTVCLLGVGGLGSWVAMALACSGIGRLTGVDGDRVELSNLNRQILFGETDIGELKAERAARALTGMDSRMTYTPIVRQLDSAAAIAEVIAGADVVVTTVDWPPHAISQWVDRACFEAGIPYLAMSQHPPKTRVGPLYVPGRTGCFACQERQYRRDYPLYDALEAAEPVRHPSATYGPACGVVGALGAGEVVRLLAGLGEPSTIGSALLLDLHTFEVEREEVPREAGCEVCSAALAVAGPTA